MSETSAVSSGFPKLKRHVSLMVAGHRHDRLPDDGVALARLDAVLASFAQLRTDKAAADAIFSKGPLYDDSDCTVRVQTGRCDGVDQRAQDSARRLGLELQLIDAGSREDAAGHPAAACDRTNWLHFGCPSGTLENDDSVHALRDEFALLHADVLIAVWDGKAARGHQGGVVRLVQRAVLAGIPVLWIDLKGNLFELDRTAMNAEREFSLSQLLWREEVAAQYKLFSAPSQTITPSIRQWLNPLADANISQPGPTRMLSKYATERRAWAWWERCAGRTDRILCAMFGSGSLRAARTWKATKPNMDLPSKLALPPPLEERFCWSDVRANIAGGRHRSTVWILYLLAALAVLAAVAGYLHVGVSAGWSSYVWPGIELAVLVAIVALLGVANKQEWHARWLGQRLMAEELRYLGLTRPFLGLPASFAAPVFAPGSGNKLVLRSAEAWLLRRALITEGPAMGESRYELHTANQDELAEAVKGMMIGEWKQLDYHTGKVKKMEKLRHHMHLVATGLFAAAIAAVVAHLAGWHWPYLLFATAFFPALAAALHGIQTKLEVARTEESSRRSIASLNAIHDAIAGHQHAPHKDAWQRTLYLRAAALRAANIMSDQAEYWRALIAQQKSDLPG